jgi:protein TonB
VLSGPAILAPAAREAVRQWRFKPYLQNGRAVETQAEITVNFLISTT